MDSCYPINEKYVYFRLKNMSQIDPGKRNSHDRNHLHRMNKNQSLYYSGSKSHARSRSG
ncbi:hypothetical protein L0Z72_03480 [candidate division KSB1 bacterium]|nr:hypothetical protein [candidate division KSB1 bacterium]